MEPSWQTVIFISAVHFAIGSALLGLAQYLSNRIKWRGRVSRALAVWPCIGLGWVFIGSAAFNVLATIVVWLLSFI